MAALKKGTPVRIVQKPLNGTVLHAETNGDEFGYRVAYTNDEGESHERFFTVDQIEATGDAPVEPASESAKGA